MFALGERCIGMIDDRNSVVRMIIIGVFLTIVPILVAFYILFLWFWDFSVPLAYGSPGADEVWQLVATKTLLDTGWVLNNPFLGAPGVSLWYGNSGSQTSAIHSIIMLGIGFFVDDAVRVQQLYFLICCSLISISTFATCRALSVATVPALAVSILLPFTSYRMNALFFAYLANYFVVPVSLLPTIWILQGKFAIAGARAGLLSIAVHLRSKLFWLSILIIVLTGISDGYYAFFSLLLLGFAIFVRACAGDLQRPSNLVVPLIFVLTMFATVLTLSYPIREYRAAHPEQANQDQMKQAIDAEVYSPSLKLLVAPIINHRVNSLADLSKWIIETANFNRKFPYSVGAPVVLGFFGTLFLIGAFGTLTASIIPGRFRRERHDSAPDTHLTLLITSILALFVLLCTVTGGIGSLVALLYPAIRAYERFAIYLVFLLYIWAALWVTPILLKGSVSRRLFSSVAVVVVAVLALFDQTPRDLLGLRSPGGAASRSERFLAEREFVREVETQLPPGAAVYQYPYSQYLTNNKYYGWGQFGQMRLYLHSKLLRWSNGGAKGSPVENWHERQSVLPLSKLLIEMRAVGFEGLVVDRLVLPQGEYEAARAELVRLTGRPPLENDKARLAFWRLDPSPVKLSYSDDYRTAASLVVLQPIAGEDLPRSVNRVALETTLNGVAAYPVVLRNNTHPTVFYDGARFERGVGQTKITPIGDMKGDINCLGTPDTALASRDTLSLKLTNRSAFDWHFNEGQFPLRIGMRIIDDGGKVLKEMSVAHSAFVESGASQTLSVPLSVLQGAVPSLPSQVQVQFAFLQDANAWFSQPGNAECRITVRN